MEQTLVFSNETNTSKKKRKVSVCVEEAPKKIMSDNSQYLATQICQLLDITPSLANPAYLEFFLECVLDYFKKHKPEKKIVYVSSLTHVSISQKALFSVTMQLYMALSPSDKNRFCEFISKGKDTGVGSSRPLYLLK